MARTITYLWWRSLVGLLRNTLFDHKAAGSKALRRWSKRALEDLSLASMRFRHR